MKFFRLFIISSVILGTAQFAAADLPGEAPLVPVPSPAISSPPDAGIPAPGIPANAHSSTPTPLAAPTITNPPTDGAPQSTTTTSPLTPAPSWTANGRLPTENSATTWGSGPAAGSGPFWAPGGYEARTGSPYYYFAPGGGEYVTTGNPYFDHYGAGFQRHSLHGHYRFPYYTYRAPWYYPGRAVYQRDTNMPW